MYMCKKNSLRNEIRAVATGGVWVGVSGSAPPEFWSSEKRTKRQADNPMLFAPPPNLKT